MMNYINLCIKHHATYNRLEVSNVDILEVGFLSKTTTFRLHVFKIILKRTFTIYKCFTNKICDEKMHFGDRVDIQNELLQNLVGYIRSGRHIYIYSVIALSSFKCRRWRRLKSNFASSSRIGLCPSSSSYSEI